MFHICELAHPHFLAVENINFLLGIMNNSISFADILGIVLQLQRENKLTKSSVMVTAGANQVHHFSPGLLQLFSGVPHFGSWGIPEL